MKLCPLFQALRDKAWCHISTLEHVQRELPREAIAAAIVTMEIEDISPAHIEQLRALLPEEKQMKAYDKQVGGSHYKKMKIQPMQYSMANKLDACQHTAIKYITRHEDKAGKKDLYKSLHTVLLLIEEKYEWTDNDSAILEAVMGAMSDE